MIIDYEQIYSNGAIVLIEPSRGIHDSTGLGAWVQKLTPDGVNTEAHQMQGKWENLPTAPPDPTLPRGSRQFSLWQVNPGSP